MQCQQFAAVRLMPDGTVQQQVPAPTRRRDERGRFADSKSAKTTAMPVRPVSTRPMAVAPGLPPAAPWPGQGVMERPVYVIEAHAAGRGMAPIAAVAGPWPRTAEHPAVSGMGAVAAHRCAMVYGHRR